MSNFNFPNNTVNQAPGLSSNNSVSNPATGGNGYLLNADSNPDELALLHPLSLSNGNGLTVPFPGILFKEEQSNSLAVHLYPHLDSARIENMGRNPAMFSVKAILTNNIYPGTNELWESGNLFPNVFTQLCQLLMTSGDKVLNHPVWGPITCQVQNWTYELNSKGPRDGAIVDINLIETIGEVNFADQLTPPAQFSVIHAANSLDTAVASAGFPGLNLGQYFTNIATLINQVITAPRNTVYALNQDIIVPTINGISNIVTAVSQVPSGFRATASVDGGITLNNISSRRTNSPSYTQNLNYTTSNLSQTIQTQKNTVLGATISNSPSYSESTYTAMQSIIALNNTASHGAAQFLNKTQTVLLNLMQHYIDQDQSNLSSVIEAIRQFLFAVQQTSNVLNLNSNAQTGTAVATYVTKTNVSWLQLSKILNNTIDNLMNLNQVTVNDLFVASNVTIYYLQGN